MSTLGILGTLFNTAGIFTESREWKKWGPNKREKIHLCVPSSNTQRKVDKEGRKKETQGRLSRGWMVKSRNMYVFSVFVPLSMVSTIEERIHVKLGSHLHPLCCHRIWKERHEAHARVQTPKTDEGWKSFCCLTYCGHGEGNGGRGRVKYMWWRRDRRRKIVKINFGNPFSVPPFSPTPLGPFLRNACEKSFS